MKNKMIILIGLTIFGLGCRGDKAEEETTEQEDSANWWEVEEDSESGDNSSTDSAKPDDTGEKPEDGSYNECPDGFDPTQTCEGSWQETICTYDGLVWWCENGVWYNEEDKE